MNAGASDGTEYRSGSRASASSTAPADLEVEIEDVRKRIGFKGYRLTHTESGLCDGNLFFEWR